jgi:hypothetical protein
MEETMREVKILPINNNFVFKNIREITAGNGNGEARLHIGSRGNKTEVVAFFNNFDQNNTYTFNCSNLIEYMHTVKFEYIYQGFQKYKNISKEYWEEQFENINKMTDFSFKYQYHRQDSNNKVYVSFTGQIYTLIRKIALPGITNLIIEKDKSNFQFLLKFREDIKEIELDLPELIFDLSPEVQDKEEMEQVNEEMSNNFFICRLNQRIEIDRKIDLHILKENLNGEVSKGDIVWLCYEDQKGKVFLDSVSNIEDILETEDKFIISIIVKKKVPSLNIDALQQKGILNMDLPLLQYIEKTDNDNPEAIF